MFKYWKLLHIHLILFIYLYLDKMQPVALIFGVCNCENMETNKYTADEEILLMEGPAWGRKPAIF